VILDGPKQSVLSVLEFLLSLEDAGQNDKTVNVGHGKHFPHVANTGRVTTSLFHWLYSL